MNARGVEDKYFLLPQPQKITYKDAVLDLKPGRFIWLNISIDDGALYVAQLLQKSMRECGVSWELTAARGRDESQLGMTAAIDTKQVPQRQGYRLCIDPERITIIAHDKAGVFYAAQTMMQIAIQAAASGRLRCLDINDWPDFQDRGVMLDISRDKVPTMETLYLIVDRLASWKINQLQLYTEHTFAYRSHKAVWENASPMTGEQILLLDSYCRQHFIELVPNQNSFGHFARWFEHEPYRHLAEQLNINTPAGFFKGWALCPVDPNSIAFLSELYDELLPNFTSTQFNVDCDEVFGLGEGRSKAAADSNGKTRLFMDHLLKIHKEADRHGKKIQFWANWVFKHPELLKDLPKDVTALVWGYGPMHPYDKQCRQAADNGVKFYVCPSTNTYCSIAGRLNVGKINMRLAAQNGVKYGAQGYLNTNWGDGGNWETLTFSWPPFAYGAAVSWADAANKDVNLPQAMNLFVFQDSAGVMGKLVCDMGNLYQVAGGEDSRFSVLFDIYHNLNNDWASNERLNAVTVKSLGDTKISLDRAAALLSLERMKCADSNTIKKEVANAAAMLRHACNLGAAKLGAKDCNFANVDMQTLRVLADELEMIIPQFKNIWLLRSRPGGLDDSIKPLQRNLYFYRKQIESHSLKKKFNELSIQ